MHSCQHGRDDATACIYAGTCCRLWQEDDGQLSELTTPVATSELCVKLRTGVRTGLGVVTNARIFAQIGGCW